MEPYTFDHDQIRKQIEKNKKSFLGSKELYGLNPFYWGIQGPGGWPERDEAWCNLFQFVLVLALIFSGIFMTVRWLIG